MVDVNAHLHTPYSFSAFASIDEALDKAAAEGVKVVGINDFYSMDGYGAWKAGCAARGLYPLLGIEFISLNAEDQAADRACSNEQCREMCAKLNEWLKAEGKDVVLDFEEIKDRLTCGLVRERHLAKALRLALCPDTPEPAKVENELRSKLLKAGGAAFVPESPEAFLPMQTVQCIIEAAGGIPTYPFLGDDAKGHFTDFEEDLQKVADTLKKRGFRSVEFITTRNTTAVLERYAGYLEDEGFIVTFGSEHNTPAMEPVRLRTRDASELTDKLKAINYRGACAVAAHQAGLDSIAAGDELIQKTLQS